MPSWVVWASSRCVKTRWWQLFLSPLPESSLENYTERNSPMLDRNAMASSDAFISSPWPGPSTSAEEPTGGSSPCGFSITDVAVVSRQKLPLVKDAPEVCLIKQLYETDFSCDKHVVFVFFSQTVSVNTYICSLFSYTRTNTDDRIRVAMETTPWYRKDGRTCAASTATDLKEKMEVGGSAPTQVHINKM